MQDDPYQGWINIRLDARRFAAAPGKSVVIPFWLRNQGTEADHLEFALTGIPPDWLGAPLPIIMLAPGEERQVSLVVQPASYPQVRAGHYPLALRMSSLRLPGRSLELDLSLIVAACFEDGPVGAYLAKDGFTLEAGQSEVFPLVVINQSVRDDTFWMNVRGIPEAWIKFTPSRLSLAPGEQGQVMVKLTPPRDINSQAGEHTFAIWVTSQQEERRYARLECRLNLLAYYDYDLLLETPDLKPGESGRFLVSNLGNSPDFYFIEFDSQNRNLAFELSQAPEAASAPPRQAAESYRLEPQVGESPGGRITMKGKDSRRYQKAVLHVPAGQTAIVDFHPFSSRPPPFSQTVFDYTIRVQSSRTAVKTAAGEVAMPPAVYPWLLQAGFALFLIALTISFASFGILVWQTEPPPTSTPAPATAVVVQDTPTLTPTPTQTFTGTLPTPTPTPTGPTPTGTATPTGITATLTATLTHSPMPSATVTLTVVPATLTPTASLPPQATEIFVTNLGKIAFVKGVDILVYDTVTRRIEPIIQGSGANTRLSWSPDGKKLAYSTNKDGNDEIYVYDFETKLSSNLTTHPADDTDPTWSPDGLWIAFTTNRDGNEEIYVMRYDGFQPRNLTNHPKNDSQPNWSMNERIAFTTDRDGNREVYLMNSDGSAAVNLSQNPAEDHSPAVARTGTFIAFTSNREGNQEIYRMNLAGTEQTNLTRSAMEDFSPSVSPDSLWIAFISNRSGTQDVLLININGSPLFPLPSFPSEENAPAWSANR